MGISKETLRTEVAKCYEASGKDRRVFRSMLRVRLAELGLSPAMIVLIIRLAIMLFDFWFSRNVSEPTKEAINGEPQFENIEDES